MIDKPFTLHFTLWIKKTFVIYLAFGQIDNCATFIYPCQLLPIFWKLLYLYINNFFFKNLYLPLPPLIYSTNIGQYFNFGNQVVYY